MTFGRIFHKMLFALCALVLSSCYQKSYTDERLYDVGYNFIVSTDSMPLITLQPEEVNMPEQTEILPTELPADPLAPDTFFVYHNNRLVVADFRYIPTDTIDSVWVQVARDQETIGWIHESDMLPNVTPDDPISWFISTFSNIHLIVFLIIVVLISVAYLMRHLLRRGIPIVHFNDIPSAYPTLLTIIVSCSATFYASIQVFVPDVWQHFFFNPTLNPFALPPILEVFLLSIWFMLIVGIAAVDDILKILPFGQAALYLAGLAAVCAIDYVFFSILTLYFVGYPLLAIYIIFAVHRHYTKGRTRYVCGNCGSRITQKGECPHCGAINK